MNIEELAEQFRERGYETFIHNSGTHIRILRRREAKFCGPRTLSWWPNSHRRTAYDENCDFSWTRATFQEVCDALEVDEDINDPSVHVVS